MLVATRANAAILSNLLSKWIAIDSLVKVAKFCGLLLPDLAVTSLLSAERVCNLMQQNLLDDLHIPGLDQVP